MIKQLKSIFFAVGFAMLVAAPIFAVAVPQTVAAANEKCEVSILGIPPWYQGLVVQETDGSCSIQGPGSGNNLDLSGFIWRVVLNVIEIALYLVGYIAVFFVLYGGFQFLTGGDNPSKVEQARKTIFNALVGLVISIGSVVVVNLIFGILG
jgi:hypothetical protein